MNPEHDIGDQWDGLDPWRDYICVELPDGHKFDPVQEVPLYSDNPDEKPEGQYDSWEEYYTENYARLADHLLKYAHTELDNEYREAFLLSAARIADLLPEDVEYGAFGSKGYIYSGIFWNRFEHDEHEACQSLLNVTGRWCEYIDAKNIELAAKYQGIYPKRRSRAEEDS